MTTLAAVVVVAVAAVTAVAAVVVTIQLLRCITGGMTYAPSFNRGNTPFQYTFSMYPFNPLCTYPTTTQLSLIDTLPPPPPPPPPLLRSPPPPYSYS